MNWSPERVVLIQKLSVSRPKVDSAEVAKALVVGGVAGLLSGLFGVGGGVLMVPALVLALGLDQRLAHGVSLTAVVPIAVSGTVSFALAGEVDWLVAGLLAIGAVGGAVVGTYFLRRLSSRALGFSFAALMLLTALRMVFDHSEAGGRGSIGLIAAACLVLIGLLAGVLAGLLGVGGGVIMVPAMVVGLDMASVLAKGTSLAVIIPTAAMGTWRNLRNGNTDLVIGGVAGLAGMASAALGAKLSVGMSEVMSNGLFAGLLAVMATQMIWRLTREQSRKA